MAQDDYIRTALRVPPGLHKELHEAAKAADRTFNAEILFRLQQSFTEEEEVGNGKVHEAVLTAVQNMLADHVLAFFTLLPPHEQKGPMNVAARDMAAAIRVGGPIDIAAALASAVGPGNPEPTLADELLAGDLFERRKNLEGIQAKLTGGRNAPNPRPDSKPKA